MSMTAAGILLNELRHARMSRGLNQDEFGKLINYSGTHASAVETGARPPTSAYAAAIDRALNTGGMFVRLLERLSDLDAEPLWLREWITYEQQARTLRWYEVAWVPGLLQTEAYAGAVFGSDGRLSAEEVETRVAARLARQQVLSNESPPQLVAVVDDTVLRRPVGGAAVMREQLFRMAQLNQESRRVRIHVVPQGVGAYAGLDGPFVIATLPDLVDVGYLDNRLRGQVVERTAEVAALREQREATLAEALTLQQSTELMMEVAKSWT
ncbi:Helix-turn-helix domain-containing protein [Micromonospora haikouensis]|uniref:Helix-turn-helix domain-containing protein n=1 Tax=Micromonospora haikouensis TaxID=686309 RepID=A0A1C4YL11_9ACTN|nr:helix-turn-helix transcriptional regulator [Micromonospora haikouensis]SCF21433.1 Helix-turn-helix domain-containing protein [Micromonospora haikouensis]